MSRSREAISTFRKVKGPETIFGSFQQEWGGGKKGALVPPPIRASRAAKSVPVSRVTPRKRDARCKPRALFPGPPFIHSFIAARQGRRLRRRDGPKVSRSQALLFLLFATPSPLHFPLPWVVKSGRPPCSAFKGQGAPKRWAGSDRGKPRLRRAAFFFPPPLARSPVCRRHGRVSRVRFAQPRRSSGWEGARRTPSHLPRHAQKRRLRFARLYAEPGTKGRVEEERRRAALCTCPETTPLPSRGALDPRRRS